MPNLKEAELSEPVSQWLKSRGLRVYAEVPHYASAIDLIGADLSKPLVVAVELKTGFTWKLLHQTMLAQTTAHEAWACAPTKPSPATVARAKELGVGLLRVLDCKVFVALEPDKTTPGSGRIPIQHKIDKLTERLKTHPEGGTGGRPCVAGEGPAHDTHARVKAYIADNPGASWKQIYRDVPNHYASYRSLAGVMNRRFGVVL